MSKAATFSETRASKLGSAWSKRLLILILENVTPAAYVVYPLFCYDHGSSKWVGLIDVGGGQEDLEVIALDEKLLVASESLRTTATGAEAVKYRLLLRQ